MDDTFMPTQKAWILAGITGLDARTALKYVNGEELAGVRKFELLQAAEARLAKWIALEKKHASA